MFGAGTPLATYGTDAGHSWVRNNIDTNLLGVLSVSPTLLTTGSAVSNVVLEFDLLRTLPGLLALVAHQALQLAQHRALLCELDRVHVELADRADRPEDSCLKEGNPDLEVR